MLLSLLDSVSSWTELEGNISNLPSEKERGEAFEQFSHAFFLLDPKYQFEKVYRHKDIPPSIRKRLGYPGTKDIGIDGLGVTADGELHAYQAKFRKDRNNKPTLRELSTFFTVSDRADWRITITNANDLPTSINDRTRQSRVLCDRLDNLDPEFFARLRHYLEENRIVQQKPKDPNRTQKEAIDAAIAHYRKNKRGQLILPCGTGKTLAAMWIAEELGGKRILVMVPSLALMSQTLQEWAENTSLSPFRYQCLCSDPTVDVGKDSPMTRLYETDFRVTTDTEEVAQFLSEKPRTKSVLFSTYQSSKVLSEATLKTATTFDVAIFDEAHRTTGTKEGVWKIALDDEKVNIKRRLFMTATPRIYATHIRKKAKEEDILLCSMDDSEVYGSPFYEMTFGEAIKRRHISDYKVVVICVTDKEVKEIIQRAGRVTTEDHEWDAKAFAKRIALVKGINAYGLKKLFTFHGKVKGAKAFTDEQSHSGIHEVFRTINKKEKLSDGLRCLHVNGTMSSGLRNGYMKEFKDAEIGIMSNARCLTEGVDVPAVDTVAFIDPKKSLIDIVQATGRAMRLAEWKKRGYVFIPVVVDDVDDPERFIESSDFETVWKVLQAMVNQDKRLEDLVFHLRVMQGRGEEGTQAWKDAMAEYKERIDFFDLPMRINKKQFVGALYTRTVEVVGRGWDFWYGLTLSYKEQFGYPNAPYDYVAPNGYKLGHWQTNQRRSYNTGRLSKERAVRLEKVGFIWDILDRRFEKGVRETELYKEEFGSTISPRDYKTKDGFRLGNWQHKQRQLYSRGELSKTRCDRLNNIEFVWDAIQWFFEEGLRETLHYKKTQGTPNAPLKYETSKGFKLGAWQSRQKQLFKQGKLDPRRVKMLEKIGFTFEPHEVLFERGFQETLKYKEEFGDTNAPQSYRTQSGFSLGAWQDSRRQNFRRGKLSKDKIRRLEAIGFQWTRIDDYIEKRSIESFEKGFRETVKHKDRYGNPNAPRVYQTPDEYRLGDWQARIKHQYKKGNLSEDKAKRLEAIGFNF